MTTSKGSTHIHPVYPYMYSSPISPVPSHFQPQVSTIPYFPFLVIPTEIPSAQATPSPLASLSVPSSHQLHTPQANIACASPVAQEDSCWFPDSSATTHLTNTPPNPHVNTPYSGSDKVIVGNGLSLHISATGSSLIPTHHKNLQLNNMLYTPFGTKNLLFVSYFSKDNKVFFEFHVEHCLVKDSVYHRVLLKG